MTALSQKARAAALCLLTLGIPIFVAGADQQDSGNPSAEAGQAKPANVSGLTQAAVNSGVLSCARRIEQIATFLTAGSASKSILFVPPSQPDRGLVSASLEVQNQNGPLAYASASFAPGMANGCGGMYETVVYWGASCDDVASRNFPGLTRLGALAGNIAMLHGGPFTRIFLMPAGAGCVSIKKEVVQ